MTVIDQRNVAALAGMAFPLPAMAQGNAARNRSVVEAASPPGDRFFGKAVPSGRIRMVYADVADLHDRVPHGTRVVAMQNWWRLDGEVDRPERKRKSLFAFFRRKSQ